MSGVGNGDSSSAEETDPLLPKDEEPADEFGFSPELTLEKL